MDYPACPGCLVFAICSVAAAKRAGQQSAAGDDPSTPDPSATSAVESDIPEVFKFTTNEDLVALSARAKEIADLPEVFGRQPEPEVDELTPTKTSRDRVKVQQQRDRKAAASMFDAKAPTMYGTATRGAGGTRPVARSDSGNKIQPALQAANNRDALLGLAAVQFQLGNHILKYL